MFKLILTADLMDLINISYFVPNELLQQKSIQSIPPPAASRFETWEEPEESEELKLEMEEIFGSSKVEEKEKEKEKKKKKKDDVFEEKMDEVIKLDDSSDLNHSNNCRMRKKKTHRCCAAGFAILGAIFYLLSPPRS